MMGVPPLFTYLEQNTPDRDTTTPGLLYYT